MKSTRIPKISLRRSLRPLVAAFVSVLLFGAGGLAQAEHVNKKGKPFPKLKLPKVAKGLDIITALGTNGAAVADWYGLTQAELKRISKEEKSLRADPKGLLHNICGLLPPVASPVVTDPTASSATTAPFPVSNTFYLHSRPGCAKVIYLDFTGHTTRGTEWNTTYAAGGDIVTPLYDTDGNPNTFSSQELAKIQLIWQRVSADFSPFEVDVTTEDPGADALQKTSPDDPSFGKRVCIGGSSSNWLGQSAGGVAYIGSFDWEIDTPVFVFPAQLGNGDPRYVSEAISHELGHSFGMHHQGTNEGAEYYSGNTDWAPIMGLGFYANLTHWSKGEYGAANNSEDEMAMIAGHLGYRADLVGNTIGTATLLSGNAPTTTGILENGDEVDVYSFSVNDGTFAVKVAPLLPMGNLFSRLTLYDKTGTPKATATPGTTSDPTISFNTKLTRGTYYLAVNGAGLGNPKGWGFSSYGSIGQYTLSANITSAPASSVPIAETKQSTPLKGPAPLTVNFSSSGSYDPDGSIVGYSWNFGDGSMGSNQPNASNTYRVPASYKATLMVTDNSGFSAAKDVGLYVCAPNALRVMGISMALSVSPTSYNYSSTATVTVSDPFGNLMPGATVKGEWTIPVSGRGVSGASAASATTDSMGSCILTSPATVLAGEFKFKVTGITLPSYIYDPIMNIVSEKRISTPAWAANAINIGAITMGASRSISGYTATAAVSVRDAYGKLMPDATVTGNWSGPVSANGVTITTDSTGSGTLASPPSATRGTFKFTVTNVALAGFAYNASQNAVTSATATPPPDDANVSAITMTTAFASGKYTAKATITVMDPYGKPVAGAAVKGNWSGAVSATGVTATTGSTGTCVLTSASTTAPKTFNFTVIGITLTGYVYDPLKNTLTTASITPPPNVLSVSAFSMTTAFASGKYTAKATIAIKDFNGNPVSGAAVKGNWSGAVSAIGATATTGTTGTCVLTSLATTTPGPFTFTVSGITLTGFTYDPLKNTLTEVSNTPPPNEVNVSAITMTTALSKGSYTAKATITVKDLSGNPRSGVAVKGDWSGVVNTIGTTATTGSTGTCVLTSPATLTKGMFTFTVSGLTLTSFTYDPLKNTITSQSITPP
jgi:hypothetical protein